MKNNLRRIGLLSLVLWMSAFVMADDFKIIKKIPVVGDNGWDALTLDSVTRRLYITHGKEVNVLDIDLEMVVGTIADTPGAHQVALVPSLNRAFISQGKANSVAVVDLGTLKKLDEISTGNNPDAIVFDPTTLQIFAFNGSSNTATVIDAKAEKAVETIPLEGKPEFAVVDENGMVYVNIEDKNSLSRINARTLEVEGTWPLTGCDEPSGLAIDTAHRRLFASCGNRVMAVVDADNGRVMTTIPIGEHVDGTVFDPDENLIFNSNGDGTLTVIQEDSDDRFHVLQNVPTQKGARTIALDSKTHQLYLVTADFGETPNSTAEHPHPRPPIVPGTFKVLVVGQ